MPLVKNYVGSIMDLNTLSKLGDIWTSFPGIREWWKADHGAFTSEFTELFEARLLNDGHSVESAIEYWHWAESVPPSVALEPEV